MSKIHGATLQETLIQKLDYDQLTNCMRCGFCLPACPTFKETGIEAESPRGRISLMKAAVDGLMKPGLRFEDQMNHCLGCRACEPACPADVKYGQLIEQARDAIEVHTTQHRWWVRGVRKLVFQELFPSQRRMQLLGTGLHFYKISGIQKLVRRTGVVGLFSKHLSTMEKILPDASGKGIVKRLGTYMPARGEKLGTVGMFRGCLMDVLFTDTNIKTVKLLTEAGFDVVIPDSQNCCGALHAHSGESNQAKQLAKSNIRAFQEAGVDYIVSNAGGCGAILVEYDHLLHDEEGWKEDSAWFSTRVKDISAILVEKGRPLQFAENQANQAPTRVTYQESCHLRNVMKGSQPSKQLLQRIGNTTYIEMKDAGSCCGSAGIYNMTQPEMANQILEHKMENVNATAAAYVVTSNPGCLLQMKLGVDKHGQTGHMEAVHIADFLYDRLVKQEA